MVVGVLVAGAVGAIALGIGGFALGASVPDERAGDAAVKLAALGAVVGFAAGAAIVAVVWG